MAIAQQTTSAVAFIHGISPKIVHCALNPANIYIQERNNYRITVKLAGFQHAEQGSKTSRYDGPCMYRPPELYYTGPVDNLDVYPECVDIWSLGVVLAEISLSLPTLPKRLAELAFCHQVVDHLKEGAITPNQGFQKYLLRNMLHIEPENRRSAQQCHDDLRHLDSNQDGGWTSHSPSGLSVDGDRNLTPIEAGIQQQQEIEELADTLDNNTMSISEHGIASNTLQMKKEFDRDSGYTSASRSYLQRAYSGSTARSRSHTSQTEIVENHGHQPDEFEPICSDDDDISSQASHETTRRERDGKALIMLFLAEDHYIRDFCEKAMAGLTELQFVEKMRKLLKMFHKSLMEEAVGEVQKTTAKLLRSRRGRVRISRNLVQHLRGPKEDPLDRGDAREGPSQEGKIGVETWLTHVSSVNEDVDNRLPVVEVDYEAVAIIANESDSEDEFPHIADLKSFLRESTSFRLLQRNSMLTLLPYTLRRILLSSPGGSVWLSREQDVSFSNRFKAWLEDSTEFKWDWRPFDRRKRLLGDKESRMFWRCV